MGSGLALLGCAFVGLRLYEYSEQIDVTSINVYGWLTLITLTVLYGFAGFLLAISWQRLLSFLNVKITHQFAINTYGMSQLAKYVPGNIFQFAGRQAVGIASGLPGRALIKSTVLELIIIAIIGALFIILGLPLLVQWLNFYLSAVLFFSIIVLVVLLVKYFYSSELSFAIIYYAMFLGCSGFMFFVILSLLLPSSALTAALFLPISAAYVTAWLAGLLAPGAPAGIGVREFVIIAILQQYIEQADLLTAVLLGRMVTVGGDMFFYLIAVMIFRNPICLIDSDSYS